MFRILLLLTALVGVKARNHTLNLTKEPRENIDISTFGYLQEGQLFVNASNLRLSQSNGLVGFSLQKADDRSTYVPVDHGKSCRLRNSQEQEQTIIFIYDFDRKVLNISRNGDDIVNITIKSGTQTCKDMLIGQSSVVTTEENNDGSEIEGDGGVEGADVGTNQMNTRRRRQEGEHEQPEEESEKQTSLPLLNQLPLEVQDNEYGVTFLVCMNRPHEEGLYNLYFHNCQNSKFDLTVHVVEQSKGQNYLSAGELALPSFYAMMSFVFLGTAIFWIVYLCKHDETVFKIHYLMFVLVVLKSLSLMFHALDYHYIAMKGSPMQTFAVLFYITYLIKGALLFSTIALVGSGIAFIKPILSDQDKKIFFVVIPLQVLANTAYIVTDTTEEGGSQYSTWRAIFFLVDILCCVAILYPVIWSIKHLQSAASTDGKAAISLLKLRLFKQFYIMVVCYIYFTRIIVALLKGGLWFRYTWVHEIFFEGATMAFFVVTAYKFRPGSDNPYLRLPQMEDDDEEDEELEIEEVIMNSGHAQGLSKHSHTNSTHVVQRDSSQTA